MIYPFFNTAEGKAALWYCPDCQESGVVMIEGLQVYDVVENLDRLHRDVSKDLCPRNLPVLLRPHDWLRKVMPVEAVIPQMPIKRGAQ